MRRPDRIVIVGASVAGICTAQELRRLGFEGQLSLIGDENAQPYDRPPLSKQILTGDVSDDEIALADESEIATLGLTLSLGTRAASLDVTNNAVVLADGTRVPFDAVVIATGAHARRPGFLAGHTGVHVLRTLSDALAIRDEIDGAREAVVVGAGFIGAEVASSLRARGLRVTLVDPMSAPLASVLGPTMGEHVGELHQRHDVVLEMGVGVAGLDGDGAVEHVVLTDGRRLRADIVVVGLGADPATGWLEVSGVELDRGGVVCDETGATSVPGVYAAGDAARWRHPHFGRHMRIEHWTSARQQAGTVAEQLLADAPLPPLDSLPVFWSDQHEWRIQMVGAPSPGDQVEIVEGRPADDKFVALYGDGKTVTGVLTVNSSRALVRRQHLVSDRAAWSHAMSQVA